MKIVEVQHEKELQDAFIVRTNVFVEEQQVPAHIENDDLEQEAFHFVGYIDQKPIAAGRFRMVDDYAKLERICVLKPYRGKALGKALILQMEQSLIEKGINRAKLGAQTHAEPFYRHLGYHTVSEVFFEANMPHVLMEKVLLE